MRMKSEDTPLKSDSAPGAISARELQTSSSVAGLGAGGSLRGAPTSTDYLRLLEKWYGAAVKWTHDVHGEPDLAFYGTGDDGHWAVQANCTAFAAIAVMATAPELEESASGLSREKLRMRALKILRYLLSTRTSGRIPTISGQPWGHSWISSLGPERMAHGIAALGPWLTPEDRGSIRRMMVSECDFLLDGFPVVGEIEDKGRNHPESNIWCGAMLFRTAAFYPDAPNAEKYRQKASEFLLNGISIPSDAMSDTLYSGKPLRAWHVGPNFTEDFGLNHHGYLNVGYMVICLSNLAMLHYSCRDQGIDPPPELYLHAADLWKLVKSLTFDDGRLWRIGGDTRVRYCYCQDYAVPMWILASDLWGDADADRFLSGWIELVATEQGGNSDGGFLSGRLAGLAAISPLYYFRLEGDRAATLSMAATWSRRASSAAEEKANPLPAMDSWHDEFHGAVMVRGRRLASWVWKSAELPTGTIVPSDRSDLVEWQWNLAGRVRGSGCTVHAEIREWKIDRFPGGFVSSGSYDWVSGNNPAEGSKPEPTARARIVFAALPDDTTVVVLQQARTLRPVYLNEVAGLFLNIPNDVYNGGERIYHIEGSGRRIAGSGGRELPEAGAIHCGSRLGIDGRMSVLAIYGGELLLRRPGKRRVNLKHNVPLHFSGEGGNLHCDLICMQFDDQQKFHERDVLLFDIGAALTVDGESTAVLLSQPDETQLKVVRVAGADGREYLLAANFGSKETEWKLPDEAARGDVLGGPMPVSTGRSQSIRLMPGETSLLMFER